MRMAALAALGAFVAVHLAAFRLHFLQGVPRSIWLSIAGGVSVAYVFVHILPTLGAGQRTIDAAAGPVLSFLEHHVYLIALAGLATFYGLDRLAIASRKGGEEGGGTDRGVFRIHIVAFALYNALVGYLLLHGEAQTPAGLAIYASAMSLHFVVTDHSLLEHHRAAYLEVGRYVLAVAVTAGYALGMVIEVSDAGLAALFAFLAGGVILNVLKEELPEERRGRFWAFAAGLGAYSALLLAL